MQAVRGRAAGVQQARLTEIAVEIAAAGEERAGNGPAARREPG